LKGRRADGRAASATNAGAEHDDGHEQAAAAAAAASETSPRAPALWREPRAERKFRPLFRRSHQARLGAAANEANYGRTCDKLRRQVRLPRRKKSQAKLWVSVWSQSFLASYSRFLFIGLPFRFC